MEYEIVLEADEETGHVTGTVVGVPSIIVDGRDEKETLDLAREAIRFYLDETQAPPRRTAPPVHAKVVTVDVE